MRDCKMIFCQGLDVRSIQTNTCSTSRNCNKVVSPADLETISCSFVGQSSSFVGQSKTLSRPQRCVAACEPLLMQHCARGPADAAGSDANGVSCVRATGLASRR